MKLLDLANTDAKAIVDDDDYEILQWYPWKQLPTRPSGTGGYVFYLKANRHKGNGPRLCYLHRFVLGEIPHGQIVDHLNGNVLDNRRVNLRVTTHRVNCVNVHRYRSDRRSPLGIRGVTYAPYHSQDPKPWYAQIRTRDRTINLGRHATLDEASAVRRAAELQHFGELCPQIEVTP